MATKTKQTTEAKLRSQLERYESFFTEIDSFVEFVKTERIELQKAIAHEAELKAAYDEARSLTKDLRNSIAGSKDALFRMVEPGATKFMPLFDRMEPADPEKHGEHCTEWRKDPITVLRLSPTATEALIAADVVCVGQLQDRIMGGGDWFESVEGLSAAIAAAIVDRLNDFVFRDGDR